MLKWTNKSSVCSENFEVIIGDSRDEIRTLSVSLMEKKFNSTDCSPFVEGKPLTPRRGVKYVSVDPKDLDSGRDRGGRPWFVWVPKDVVRTRVCKKTTLRKKDG